MKALDPKFQNRFNVGNGGESPCIDGGEGMRWNLQPTQTGPTKGRAIGIIQISLAVSSLCILGVVRILQILCSDICTVLILTSVIEGNDT